MLRILEIEAAPVAQPLLNAIQILRDRGSARPVDFLRQSSKWHRHLNAQPYGDDRLWEVAVLFHLRDAFRSGDIWLRQSRRYADLKQALVPNLAAANSARLAVPLHVEDWLSDRRTRLTASLKRLGQAARSGAIPGGAIENGVLHIDKLTASTPDGAEDLILDLYSAFPTRVSPIFCWR